MFRILVFAVALATAQAAAATSGSVVVIHQSDFVSTNRTVSGSQNARAATDMQLGPGWKTTHKTLGQPGHQVKIWRMARKAGAGPQRPLVVFCGDRAFEPDYNGAETLTKLAGFGDVLLFDYPGLGTSEGTGSKKDYANLVALLRREISTELYGRPVLYWGHQLGSAICARLASQAVGPSTALINGIRMPPRAEHPGLRVSASQDMMNISVPALLKGFQKPLYLMAPQGLQSRMKAVFPGHDVHLIGLTELNAAEMLDNPMDTEIRKAAFFRPVKSTLAKAGFPYHALRHARYSPRWKTGCKAIAGSACIYLSWPDGTRFAGHIRDGKINGPSRTHFAEGGWLTANYSDDQVSGTYRYVSVSGKAYMGRIPPKKHTMMVNGVEVQAPSPLVTDQNAEAWYANRIDRRGHVVGTTIFTRTPLSVRQEESFVDLRPADFYREKPLLSGKTPLPHIDFEAATVPEDTDADF